MAVVTLVLLTTLVACGEGDETVDSEQSAQTLEQQRLDVRSSTAELMRSAAEVLGAAPTSGSGQFRGCESSGPETFRNFSYRATARLDVGPDTTRPYLDTLAPVLQDAGFEAIESGERPGGRTLTATRNDIESSFSELPDQGDYVLLAISGPCIDVPEDDSDLWLARLDEEPIE